eukprot:m.20354 g.20354  ORF g.20354 m.20354 type:complete len:378 (+) comp28003_c0_seq1:444-1577(+)
MQLGEGVQSYSSPVVGSSNDGEETGREDDARSDQRRTKAAVSKEEADIAKAIAGGEVSHHEPASLAFKAAMCIVFTMLMWLYPLLMAMTKVDGKFAYHSSSAVLLVELSKLASTIFMCVIIRPSFDGFNVRSVLVLAVPSVLYVISNNLTYTALEHASPVSLTILSNVRLLMVAFIYRLILARPISRVRWVAMVCLTFGVTGSQMRLDMHLSVTWLGLILILLKAFLSVVCGIYTEIVLKHHISHFHVQNLQMYTWGVIINFLLFLFGSNKPLLELKDTFFEGFTLLVWVSIFVGAMAGIVSGAVMKHLDNIAKFFGTSVATIMLGLFTAYLLPEEFQFSFQFLLGALVVGMSSYVYSINKTPVFIQAVRRYPVQTI